LDLLVLQAAHQVLQALQALQALAGSQEHLAQQALKEQRALLELLVQMAPLGLAELQA
jgi:hypothetical protein